MNEPDRLNLRVIGVVKSGLHRLTKMDPSDTFSEIIIEKSLAQALDGLNGFSHLIVIYWLHLADGDYSLKVHPRGKRENPLVGLFATRSPHRPNPLGITTVRLLEQRNNVLLVKGLDAFNGTPVIDIKPYIHSDCVADAEVPFWIAGHRQAEQRLRDIYRRLYDCYGPQYWWPADSAFEMMIGAILTQSAAWRNVEKAIANLRNERLLSPDSLRQVNHTRLAELIRPCGYYNVKAMKLKSLARWLKEVCSDDLDKLFRLDTSALRRMLISVHGVGEETADSILLYAAGKPVFVIDAYTRRIIDRLGMSPQVRTYTAYQMLFLDNIATEVGRFQEYHALLVRLAKDACRRKPLCRECCLKDICPTS
jgi:endonuclease-3 related protein